MKINAYIRPYGNIVAVDNVWQQRKVRAGQKTCHHIAQNKRLVKFLHKIVASPASVKIMARSLISGTKWLTANLRKS